MTLPDSSPIIINCPRCHKPCTWHNNPHRPFCSERCKLIDLGAWASEEYKIPQADSSALTESDD
ncbi:MAG: DNA gyrase inhibitor YacG [Moraxellaceae bacterium]|nr:DNA gyrase inhibitor YacG [Pseudomonadales bacterium]MCP5175665.1 DNA gyrase inhibitor YacG [Moraxellaceae bacterium]MCP5175929.1 DNA gyrase inhibitor YacG [Moraxellaceae bacterium]